MERAIAAPTAGNSNVILCVGTIFAGPLLKLAHEPPGFFHFWGASKIAKSLVGAIGQSVWGRPKVPGEADAFGASWTATAVGLERYAILRSDVGAYLMRLAKARRKLSGPPSMAWQMVRRSCAARRTSLCGRWRASAFWASPRVSRPWKSYLSSGGEKVPAGLKVRLVDVPAEVQARERIRNLPARAN